jgi:hypothetical protein
MTINSDDPRLGALLAEATKAGVRDLLATAVAQGHIDTGTAVDAYLGSLEAGYPDADALDALEIVGG